MAIECDLADMPFRSRGSRPRPAPGDDFRALIVGASGFVGRWLYRTLGPQRAVATFCRHPIAGGIHFDARVQRLAEVLRALPQPVTHVFMLYGAIDMDGCARDPQATARVNIDSVLRMLDDCIACGAKPVYVSTDYVFDGSRGCWKEEDEPEPVMEYGRQKLAIERHLSSLPGPWLATRLSRVVSGDTDTHSLLGQWSRDIALGRTVRCAHDQVFSPAHAGDVAAVMIELARGGHTGLVNLGGPIAWSRLALLDLYIRKVRELRPEIRPSIVPISLHDLPFLEQRPLDTSLDTTRLQSLTSYRFVSMPQLCGAVARAHFGRTAAAVLPLDDAA